VIKRIKISAYRPYRKEKLPFIGILGAKSGQYRLNFSAFHFTSMGGGLKDISLKTDTLMQEAR
jgi:hypothetical protein